MKDNTILSKVQPKEEFTNLHRISHHSKFGNCLILKECQKNFNQNRTFPSLFVQYNHFGLKLIENVKYTSVFVLSAQLNFDGTHNLKACICMKF